MLAPGARIGSFEILALLGAGGMGEVYRARDTRLGREVAIKVLPAERMADEGRRRRFAQEARAASALNHRHIVTIHEIESADGIDHRDGVPAGAVPGNARAEERRRCAMGRHRDPDRGCPPNAKASSTATSVRERGGDTRGVVKVLDWPAKLVSDDPGIE
jgi:serine/threonine protein kinase